MKEQRAVTIIRDVHGPVEFSDGSVMFIMPAILLARSASSHQLLMREIEDRYNVMAEAAAAEAEDPLPAEAPTLAALSSTSGRWRVGIVFIFMLNSVQKLKQSITKGKKKI